MSTHHTFLSICAARHQAELRESRERSDRANREMCRGQWAWRFVDEDEWHPVDGLHQTEASALAAACRTMSPEDAADVEVDELDC